jgi:hypothetical protein
MYYLARTILRWTVIDAVGTQAIIIAHNIAIRSLLGPEMHGLFSTCIALIYGVQAISNWGLDATLPPYIQDMSSSKRAVMHGVRTIAMPQLTLVTIIAIAAAYGMPYIMLHWFSITLSQSLTNIACALFFFESLKRTMKRFLRLTLRVKTTSLLELIGVMAYVLITWTQFLIHPIGLIDILWPFLFVSIAQCLFLIYNLYIWYLRMPNTSSHTHSTAPSEPMHFTHFYKNRFFIGMNEVASQLFTSNMLVPFFALYCSVGYASLFSIVSSSSKWIAIIALRAFGTTGSILFAYAKNKTMREQKQQFTTMTHAMHQFLYGAVAIAFVYGGYTARLTCFDTYSTALLPLAFCMLAIMLLDSFLALYLQWYIMQEKPQYFAAINLSGALLAIGVMSFAWLSDFGIILLLFGVRLTTYMTVACTTYYIWRLKPSFAIKRETAIITIVLMCIAYGIMQIM